ncbi:MAG: GWxTD domain-containing protein [Bacteroidia bacterium]|nr:GWxTD domain-containing protein [Bacteroidia bacterium]
MKKPVLLLLACLFGTIGLLNAKNLQARLSYCSFLAPEKGPYLETYLSIEGHSVYYQQVSSGVFQASIEAKIVFKQGDSIRYFDKYNLLGPETSDTLNAVSDFTDLQRISLPNGAYLMELSIRDKNNPAAKPYLVKQEVIINYYTNVISVSDIELLSSYQPAVKEGPLVKNGYEIVPLVDNFYGQENNTMKFYCEYYHTKSVLGNHEFLLTYQIVNFESHRIVEANSSFSRQVPKEVGILMSEFDITDLPSGNYNLVVSIRDKDNNLLATKEVFFQRSKPLTLAADAGELNYMKLDVSSTFAAQITHRDTLAEYIRCLWPISSPNENTFALNQLEMADAKLMQQFFYDFWQRRNVQNPQLAWMNYKAEVDKVNAAYTVGKKKGYMTERGRVYLKYGAPNQISKAYNEPSTYPYEIWQYYTLSNQSNRKFVFYCPEIGGNDFSLLHSDARGEIFESQWMVILKKRTETMNDIDKTKARSTYGNQFEQLFQNPR